MKRPKLADMNPLEEVRWRLLQCRRSARRSLRRLENINDPDTAQRVAPHVACLQTILAITKPSWVHSASFPDALHALAHIVRICEGAPQRAN
jgi:hypothetical protein